MYDGDWNQGVRHGDCEYTWFNGEKLKCQWVNGRSPEWTAKNAEILAHSGISVQIWDLAGQDVYIPLGGAANLVLVQEADILAAARALVARAGDTSDTSDTSSATPPAVAAP